MVKRPPASDDGTDYLPTRPVPLSFLKYVTFYGWSEKTMEKIAVVEPMSVPGIDAR